MTRAAKQAASYLSDRRMCTRNQARDEVLRVAVVMTRVLKLNFYARIEFYRHVGMSDDEVTRAQSEVDARGYFGGSDYMWHSLV
jgi:hypothetical protein